MTMEPSKSVKSRR